MDPPTCAREALLNCTSALADASISVRAIVCRGSFLGRESRACSAASFAELKAWSGRGGGYDMGPSSEVKGSSMGFPSSYVRSIPAEEDCDRVLAMLCCCCCCRRQHGLVRGESNCPLHLSSRNLFIDILHFSTLT